MKARTVRVIRLFLLICSITVSPMLGQFSALMAAPSLPLSDQAAAHTAAPNTTSVPVVLPTNVTGDLGAQVTIPVLLPQSVDGLGITAFELRLTYDPAILAITNVNNAGTMSAGWSITPNLSTPGEVQVVAFSANPLSGSGTLINLIFSVEAIPTALSPLTWTEVQLNEGDPAAEASNGSFIGQAISVTLPDDATTPPNSQVTIPVGVPDAVDGLDIIAYSFRLTFDPSVLSLPTNAADAYDTAGTLSDGWTITANTDNPGELRLAGFHIAPLSGSGTLLNLVFDVVGPANSSTALTWSDFLFNEGVPGVETTDGFLTVVSWTLAGQVFYQENANRAMSGVTLDLSGATTAQTATDAEGYSFTIEATGAHTVTPSYAGPANGISAFDAAYIAQCVAGLRNTADCPLLAADTSGNSSLSAFDAALIAQYAAGLAGPTSRVGTWVFAPEERVYPAINSDLSAENYGAYLVGEVTGNWSPPAAAAATREANGVQTAVPLAVATVADQTAVTLNLVQPQDDLLAFEITMHYDATAGHFVEALPLAGWHLVTNEVEPGLVKLVGYGVTPATDELVTLHFQSAAGTAQTVTPVLTMVQLNEASPWLAGTQDEEAEVLSWKEYLPIIVK